MSIDGPAPSAHYEPSYSYQQPYAAPAAAAPQTTSGMAIASLVLSLAGFAGLAFIGPVLGVILGHLALSEIKKANGLVGGESLAQAGLIIGYIGIGLSVLVACGLLALFGFFAGGPTS
jgi:hypothetical protein